MERSDGINSDIPDEEDEEEGGRAVAESLWKWVMIWCSALATSKKPILEIRNSLDSESD